MTYSVDIIPRVQQYDPEADEALFWNVHSTYNEGYRITDSLWEWIREQRLEVEDWSSQDIVAHPIEDDDEDANDDVIGVKFTFTDPDVATLFKLTWA